MPWKALAGGVDGDGGRGRGQLLKLVGAEVDDVGAVVGDAGQVDEPRVAGEVGRPRREGVVAGVERRVVGVGEQRPRRHAGALVEDHRRA